MQQAAQSPAAPDTRKLDHKRRLALPHPELPVQAPGERIGNFEEVLLPLDAETARAAAEPCIHCPSLRCMKACPLDNDIPLALWQIEQGDFEGAARTFRLTNTMPEICGRVCPQAVLCEGACPHIKAGNPPVPIGRLEAFVADLARANGGRSLEREADTGHRVAVVGAGPAGMTVAELLARNGHAVTVFDALPRSGGVMRYGIPHFKLDHRILDEHASFLEALGVEFVFNTRIGSDRTVDDLLGDGYGAVFLGVGAGVWRELDIPGSELKGIHQATPFLIRANVADEDRPADLAEPPEVGDRVAVIGGGDTAMDCVRTAIRLGSKQVSCVYRRTEVEMPGNERDREYAKEEGATFHWLTQPVQFLGDQQGRVVGMECVQMQLGAPDESGRRRPAPVEGSEFTMSVDTVILALGYGPDPSLEEAVPGLETDGWGLIAVDGETGATSREGIFAGGDDVLGPALVVNAIAHGRRAADAIDAYLTGS